MCARVGTCVRLSACACVCNYSHLSLNRAKIEVGKENKYARRHNLRVSDYCQLHTAQRFESLFTNSMCLFAVANFWKWFIWYSRRWVQLVPLCARRSQEVRMLLHQSLTATVSNVSTFFVFACSSDVLALLVCALQMRMLASTQLRRVLSKRPRAYLPKARAFLRRCTAVTTKCRHSR